VIEGREYPHLNPVQSTACGIQVIYQDLSLFPNLTVAENIAVGRHLGPAGGELAHNKSNGGGGDYSHRRSLILLRASRISQSRAANWWRSVARWRPTRGL
jgi:ABC-type branched-subunit amino acid transport system ATPase component